jgi:hypothetical protein
MRRQENAMTRNSYFAAAAIALFVTAACGTGGGGGTGSSVVVPGQGALAVAVDPNPIIATRVSGDTYDFPFRVNISNPGTLAVNIERVTLDVVGPGGIGLHRETMDRTEIERRGYPTIVAAGQTLTYAFNPRQSVPTDAIFSSIAADISAVAVDTAGSRVTARMRVTVRR